MVVIFPIYTIQQASKIIPIPVEQRDNYPRQTTEYKSQVMSMADALRVIARVYSTVYPIMGDKGSACLMFAFANEEVILQEFVV